MVNVMLVSDVHYGFSGNTANKIEKFCIRMSQKKPDIVILAGDLATTTQHQYKRCLQTFRKHFKDTTILTVRGNHDLWDGLNRKDKNSSNYSLGEIYRLHETIYKDNDITHLDTPYTIGDVTFFGFDGWYCTSMPNTNDENWIPRDHQGCPTMSYLCSKSFKDFDRVLDQVDNFANKKNVLVSHFPSINIENDRHDFNASPGFLPEITSRFDVVCYGHSHRLMDKTIDGCRILNCGSDYNQPKAFLFSI